MKQQQLPEIIAQRFIANYQIVHIVGDEFHRYLEAVQKASQKLKDEKNIDVDVICHDKVCGFYRGQPGIKEPADKTNKPLIALPAMMASDKDMQRIGLAEVGKIFNPKTDVIFVLKDWDSDLAEKPDGAKIVQYIRNIIHSNMGSLSYYSDEDENGKKLREGNRGQRMLVFVTTTDKIPPTLPEFKPMTIPLPDVEILREVVDRVVDPLQEQHKATKGNKGFITPENNRIILAKSLSGMTAQGAEDALSLAVARYKTLDSMDDVLEMIEIEKSLHISGVPGLEYISRDLIKGFELPGYEAAVDFIKDRIDLDPIKMLAHNLKGLNGVTLVGTPGVGKTVFGFLMSLITNRILIKWSFGESKGGIVGQSQANVRRGIQVAQALNAVVLLDDIDKGSLGAGGNGGGDSGTTGDMIQMLLTEMSRPDNKAIWCFTLNRVQNVPPELIRPGRMDAIFYVQRPDPVTRKQIAMVHLKKRNWTDIDEAKLDEFVNATEEMVGAEIEALIHNTSYRTLRLGGDKFNWSILMELTSAYTPMSKQDVYAADLAMMEKFSKQFIQIGRVGHLDSAPATPGKPAKSRSSRSLV